MLFSIIPMLPPYKPNITPNLTPIYQQVCLGAFLELRAADGSASALAGPLTCWLLEGLGFRA